MHRLVAEYFLEKVDNKKFVNHKDCNKLNNNVENLEWCTISENTKHAWDNNKMNLSGIKNGRSKLSLKDIEEIRNSKESVSFLSKKFKVCNKTIYKVKNKISYI